MNKIFYEWFLWISLILDANWILVSISDRELVSGVTQVLFLMMLGYLFYEDYKDNKDNKVKQKCQ